MKEYPKRIMIFLKENKNNCLNLTYKGHNYQDDYKYKFSEN